MNWWDLIREAGDVLEDLLDLSAADITSKQQERRRAADARVSALRERIDRIRAEVGSEARVIATGGLADLIAPHARTIERVDPDLTLEGLRLVWALNA